MTNWIAWPLRGRKKSLVQRLTLFGAGLLCPGTLLHNRFCPRAWWERIRGYSFQIVSNYNFIDHYRLHPEGICSAHWSFFLTIQWFFIVIHHYNDFIYKLFKYTDRKTVCV